MQQKKIPLRKCSGCNVMKPKRELIRVVKSPDDEISLDLTGKKAGRGAYVCPNLDCIKKAQKAKRFEKAFQCQIPEDVFDKIEKELCGHE